MMTYVNTCEWRQTSELRMKMDYFGFSSIKTEFVSEEKNNNDNDDGDDDDDDDNDNIEPILFVKCFSSSKHRRVESCVQVAPYRRHTYHKKTSSQQQQKRELK